MSDEAKRNHAISSAFTLSQSKLVNESKIDVQYSGTTCVICFLSQNMLVCANAGDSRAILCSFIANNWQCTVLSRDHKPDEADEAARIRKCNGRIEPSRTTPGKKGG
jgi:serine/threonine protein phosphatase PrpC